MPTSSRQALALATWLDGYPDTPWPVCSTIIASRLSIGDPDQLSSKFGTLINLMNRQGLDGLIVAYEKRRNETAYQSLKARGTFVAKKMVTLKNTHAAANEAWVNSISRQGVRTLNEDGSMTLREVATSCRGQHVPAAIMTTMREEFKYNDFGLELIIAGSHEDNATGAAQAADASCAGALVESQPLKKKRKESREQKVRERREEAAAAARDHEAGIAALIKELTPAHTCSDYGARFVREQLFTKHCATCIPVADAEEVRHTPRPTATLAHTRQFQSMTATHEAQRQQLGFVKVEAESEDTVRALIGGTHRLSKLLVPPGCALEEDVKRSDSTFVALLKRPPAQYSRGQARRAGQSESFTPTVALFEALYPMYNQYKSGSAISMNRLQEVLNDTGQFAGKEYLVPTLSQLNEWWTSENSRNGKPLLALGSKVSVSKDRVKKTMKKYAGQYSSDNLPSRVNGVVESRRFGYWYVRLDNIVIDGSHILCKDYAKNLQLLPSDPMFKEKTHGGRKKATTS